VTREARSHRSHPESLRAALEAHLRTPLFGNAYALIANTGASALLGMLYWVVAARYYDADVVGRNAALVSAMMFLGGIAQLNLESVIIRFLPSTGTGATRFLRHIYIVTLVAATGVGLIFILGLPIWAPDLGFLREDPGFGLWFVFAVLSWCVFHLQDSVLTGLRRAVWVPVENILFGIAKILLLLVLSTAFDEFGIFASWTIPVALSLLPVNLLIFVRLVPEHANLRPEVGTPHTRTLVRYFAGDYLGSLFFLASTTLLPLLVTRLAGAEANAYFYQAWIISFSLQMVAINTTTSLTVEAAHNERMLHAYGRRIFVSTVGLLGPAVAITVILAPHILRVFGEAYAREGATSLRFLSLAALPSIVVLLALAQARLQKRVSEVVLIQASGSLLVLGLSTLLLPRYGISGVGQAWLASQSLVAFVLLLTRMRWLIRPAPPHLSHDEDEAQTMPAP